MAEKKFVANAKNILQKILSAKALVSLKQDAKVKSRQAYVRAAHVEPIDPSQFNSSLTSSSQFNISLTNQQCLRG